MAKKKTVLRWDVLLDDAEWERRESLDELLDGPHAHAAPRRRRLSNLWATVFVALLLVGCGAYWAWREARKGLETIDGEIASAVQAETDASAALPGGNSRYPATLASAQSETAPVESGLVESKHVALRSGLAMVEVTTNTLGHAYRETRFYRQEPDLGWQRAAPDARFWGDQKIVETTYFRFHYAAKDAEAVESVAAQIDAIYDQLSADIGLPPTLDKLEIRVLPVAPEKLGVLEFKEGRLDVMSPKLLAVPVEVSDDVALLKSIVHPLVVHVMREAIVFDRPGREWDPMTRGLMLWQVFHLPHGAGDSAGSEMQRAWYDETVGWLYGDALALSRREQEPSANDLWILCREYSTWHSALPADLSLHMLCVSTYWGAMVRNLWIVMPNKLANLQYEAEMYGHADTGLTDWGQVVAASTVVDYLVTTYGREHLPTLMYGFRAHGGWETLIPAMLDISAKEFEAGWQEYLQGKAQLATGQQP